MSVAGARLDINVLMLVAVAGAVALGQWSEGGLGRVPLRARAAARGARDGARARRDSRADGSGACRRARPPRRRRERTLPVDDVRVGDVVIVRPGEKIPLDGSVTAGESHVNQAPVTGESLPVEKAPGDEVFAGTINGRGALDVEVTRLRARLDARAHHSPGRARAGAARARARRSSIGSRASTRRPCSSSPSRVAVVPPLLGGHAGATWIYRALVLLVISCPCALVISTPVSIVSALAAAARKGVLIKGGAHARAAGGGALRGVRQDRHADHRAAARRRRDCRSNGVRTGEILPLAASLETRSEHPIGRAIVEHARPTGWRSLAAGRRSRRCPGAAPKRIVGDARVLVGNHRLFEERGSVRRRCDARARSRWPAAAGAR